MSGLNPSEISSVLKDKISGLDLKAETKNEGTIVNVSDGIIRIHGMGDVMYGEIVEFENGVFGLALNLEQDSVGAVVLGDYTHISEGDTVKTTNRILEVPVGDALLGRVVNSLGEPLDGKGPIEGATSAPIEKIAPGVIARQSD
jgi:F-type H+-transporting ATPase subunit alpha